MIRARTKYYLLLSLLGALVVAGGGLALTPSARAQSTPPQCDPSNVFCIDKRVTPNPVQVGQPLTFEIELTENIGITLVNVTDVLPPGVEFVSVSPPPPACNLVGNTVECFFILVRSQTITIEVIPRECGTFTNTATAATPTTLTVSDTEAFTVVGCGGGAAAPGEGQQPGEGGPVTLETENEAQSGPLDLGFDVSNEGEHAGQCVPAEQFGQTGNAQDAPSSLQLDGEADDFEAGGVVGFAAEPGVEVACDRTVGQSSGASG